MSGCTDTLLCNETVKEKFFAFLHNAAFLLVELHEAATRSIFLLIFILIPNLCVYSCA